MAPLLTLALLPQPPAWVENLGPAGAVALLSIMPASELSFAIPYGILFTNLPTWQVVTVALLCNMLIAPLVYLFMTHLLHLVIRWRPIGKLWDWFSTRVRNKVSGPMNRWGKWGVFVLVAIPGPGSGLYTLGVGSFLLGINFTQYLLIAFLGQCVAATLVTIAALSGNAAWDWMLHGSLAVPVPTTAGMAAVGLLPAP